jgi:hypothetical protein
MSSYPDILSNLRDVWISRHPAVVYKCPDMQTISEAGSLSEYPDKGSSDAGLGHSGSVDMNPQVKAALDFLSRSDKL